MLRLWRDQIDVFLAPDRIDLVHTSRGLKPVIRPVITEQIAQPNEGQVAWEKPLQQLDEMLSGNAGAGMTVTLSNHFVRYVVLLPQAEITTPEEVSAYADFRMHEIYGSRVDHWAISISHWNPLYGAVSAAIPQEFMAKVEEICERRMVRLNGIEPYFTAVLNRWGKGLNRKKSYVALIENGRLCVGVLEDNIWRNIRNQRILNNPAAELWATLDQEAVLSGQKEIIEQVFLFAPEYPLLVLPPDCGWQAVSLPTDKLPVPGHYPQTFTAPVEENACHA